MREFLYVIRVYYAETDAIGIVYHANYLKYFEVARTEGLRELGVELPWLLAEHGLQFAVVKIEIQYHKPARLDDELLIVSKVSKIGNASVTYEQYMYYKLENMERGDLLCHAHIKLVTVDKNMRPQMFPAFLKAEILKHDN